MDKDGMDFMDTRMLRSVAEKQLTDKHLDAPLEEIEVKKMVHELQVHQIELEMQNEELRLAYETTEKALRKFTMLYDFASMGYFTLDRDGHISELNFAAAEMLGEKRFALIDKDFRFFVSEQSKPVFNNFLKELYTTYAKESCELILGYNDNPMCIIYVEGIVTGDDNKCLFSAVNITAFRKQQSGN